MIQHVEHRLLFSGDAEPERVRDLMRLEQWLPGGSSPDELLLLRMGLLEGAMKDVDRRALTLCAWLVRN